MRQTRSHHKTVRNSTPASLQNEAQSSSLSELVRVLKNVKTDTPEAKANETSMSDNNGKRIKYKRGKIHHKKTTSH